MIKLLIKKEILENIFSFKFLIMFLMVFLSVNTAIFIMTRDYKARLLNYDLLKPSNKEAFAITYPTPLSIFAHGLDDRICNLYQISFGGQIETGSQMQAINKIYNFFNTPDLLYIINIILSFCAILFASDLISREKEQGTLKLIFSNGIKRTAFSIGKWIGGYIIIIIPIMLSVLFGMIFFVILAGIPFQSMDFIRLLIFLFFALIYLAGFFSIGLFISIVSRNSAFSMFFSLIVWVSLVFIIPRSGNLIAKQFIKIPSVQTIEIKRSQVFIKAVFEYINSHYEKSKIPQDIVNQQNDKIREDYLIKLNAVETIARKITSISPSSDLTFLCTDLCNTGFREEQRFKTFVIGFKEQVKNFDSDSDGNLVGDFAPFIYDRSPLSDFFKEEILLHFLILILYILVPMTLGYFTFLTFDVR
jgi:ABC-type transport system involved in multi-copper enzyme maturation permease subunit